MAGDGPTTAGSIVGKLKLDTSDWDAKIAAADAAARKLGTVDPNIRVDADTAVASEKLAAVAAEASKVGAFSPNIRVKADTTEAFAKLVASNKTLEAATQAATRAQLAAEAAQVRYAAAASLATAASDRQWRVEQSLTASVREKQAATDAETRALAAADVAAIRLTAAEDALSRANVKVAASAEAASAASDKQGKAADGAGKGNAANLGYMGMILAVVAALVPVMSQLVGFIAGVGGAFLGLGVAGVLAVLGIKAAMAAGTTTGFLYGSAVDQLKQNLTELEQTAASGLLGPFQQMVQEMTAAMPQLSAEIGGFASDLGRIGSTVMGTLVQGFAILNPLFRQGAQYLQGLASAWQAWVSNGGLQRFAQDAQQALPLVAHTLSEITGLVVNLIAALSPLGTIALTVIGALATALNAIPPQILAEVAVGATAAFMAFKAWAVLGPILEGVATAIGAVGIASDIAEGPVGWVIGLVGLAAAALTGLATSTSDNTAATTAYTTALQQSNGALDDNVRKTVAAQLATAGVLETARQYHLQLSTVTDAVLGNTAAQQQVNDAINQYGQHLVEVHGYGGAVTNQYTTMTDKARGLSDAVNGQNKSLKDSVQAYQDQTDAAASSNAAEDQQIQAANTLTTALNNQTNAATFLNNAFKLLNGQSLSAAEAQTAQAAAFNTVTDSISKNGAAIDGNSAAAIANQQAIQQAAQAAQQNAAAIVTQTGSTDAGTQAFANSKQALENQLAAQGNLTPAVQAYINTLFQVPTELTTQLNVDNAAALAAIASTQSALSALGQSESKYGIAPQNMATSGTGGVKRAFAAGGTVAGPGSSTSDSVDAKLSASEEVVSNGSGQADRWRSVLKLINANASGTSILGKVLSMAGSMAPQSFTVAPQSSKSVVNNTYVTNQFTVLANDPNELTQKVSMRQNRMGVV